MRDYTYVENFKKLGFGMFVHFGLYSVWGKGEWSKETLKIPYDKYNEACDKFVPVKDWAKRLVKTAKKAGVRYITLTTRHHDGFSLYDTKGLSDYDVMHTKCGRDLVREFVDACNEGGIVPFFYHTLLDWYHPDFVGDSALHGFVPKAGADFSKYIDYLVKSIEVLCTSYGKIGGFWFDGMWSNWNGDWQEDRLYGTIRKYQPEAIIINNTGLSREGEQGHPELDSVTFERGNAKEVSSARPLAGEVCEAFNYHWGYAQADVNYKPLKEILLKLVGCRAEGCNMLLNVGPLPSGKLRTLDEGYFEEIGRWIKANKNLFYSLYPCDITCDKAVVLTDGKYYYAIYDGAKTLGSEDVQVGAEDFPLTFSVPVKNAKFIDNGKPAKTKKNTIIAEPFDYGVNLALRIVRFSLK